MKTNTLSRFACPVTCLLIVGAAYAQDPFTNGLVAFYPFNGNANDATGNGNNGTVNGVTLTAGHYGTSNSAYAFPGVGGKNITINSTNLMMQAPFSFSLWLNLSGGTQSPRIVCLDANWQGYTLVAGAGSPRTLVFETDYGSGGYSASSSNSFADGVWHQAVCVRTTNMLFIYVDGRLQGSAPALAPVVYPPNFGTAWLPTVGGQATIGYPYDNYGGSIDSVRFYNRALSSQDVSHLYAYETLCLPHPATATAIVSNGFVVSATITDSGCGYTNTPQVLIVGGGGSGATAAATVSYGIVTDITITSAGIGYTNTPTILIGSAPVIGTQPQSITVNAGDSAKFTVTDSDFTPATYQWSLNGTNLPGANSSMLTVPSVSPSDLGSYSVVISNAFGAVTSSNAVLSMYPALVVPFSGGVTYWGTNATFSVEAEGSGPLTYQWYFNGVVIQDATNATLNFSSIQLTNAGLYSVVVSNPYGSVTNETVQVVVTPAGVSFGLSPRITISGVVGNNYLIRRTSDLTDTNSWTVAGSLTLTEPVEVWVDTNIDSTLPRNPHYYYEVLPAQ